MKPARFEYHAPETVEECLRLLSDHKEEASLLAGGQSLVPLMRFRLAQPHHVIALRALNNALGTIRSEDGFLKIGACATYAEVQRSAEVRAGWPGLASAISLVATPAIRNRGTVCGNLCQADPASELPAVALALEAQMVLRSHSDSRTVSADKFFVGPYMTDRRSDELLTEIRFPLRATQERFSVREVTRLRGGFPMAGVVVAATRGQATTLSSAAVAVFALNAKQTRIPEAERALIQLGYTQQGIEAAADALDRSIEPYGDPFASVEYKRAAARILLKQALKEACEREGAGQ